MALSMFTEICVPGRIIVLGDAAASARNLGAGSTIFAYLLFK